MPAIFSRNAIFYGLVDYYCLICAVKLTEESVMQHMIDAVHKENLRLFPYLEKYKSDCIRKIKKIYYCELCNLILTTATKVGFHVDEASHVNNKHNINKFRRLDSHIIYNNEIIIRDDAWNGLIDESCVLCNTEFDDKEEHKHDMAHIIKLIQNDDTIFYQQFAGLYRKLDDTTFHCLTCNLVKSNQSLDKHFNSEAFHLENYQASLYDYNTADTIKTNSECGQKEEKRVLSEVPCNEEDISENKVEIENEKKVPEELNDKLTDKKPALKQSEGKRSKKDEKVRCKDERDKTVSSDDDYALLQIKMIGQEDNVNHAKKEINVTQDVSKLEEINNKIPVNVNLTKLKDTYQKTDIMKVADKDAKEKQENVTLSEKDKGKKPASVQKAQLGKTDSVIFDTIHKKPLETVNPDVAVKTIDNNEDFKQIGEKTDEEIFKILGIQSYVVTKLGEKFCILCDVIVDDVKANHLTNPHHLAILKLHKESKEKKNSTIKHTDVKIKTEEISKEIINEAGVKKQEFKEEKCLKEPPKIKDKKRKVQTKRAENAFDTKKPSVHSLQANVDNKEIKKDPVVAGSENKKKILKKVSAEEFIRSIAFFDLFGIKQVAINDQYVINIASFMCFNTTDEMHKKCELCNSDFFIGDLMQHLLSNDHKSSMSSIFVLLKENEFIREIRPNILHCGYCNMILEGPANLDLHFKSRIHYEQKTTALWLLAMYQKKEDIRTEMTMQDVLDIVSTST